MIPKLIHKTGHFQSEDQFPPALKQTFTHNREMCPDYEFRYYNDQDCERVVHSMFGNDGLAAYRNVIPGAFRADIFRFCIMSLHGGVYSDLAQKFLVPLHDIIDHEHDEIFLTKDFYGGVQINVFASVPGHAYFLAVAELQISNVLRKKMPSFIKSWFKNPTKIILSITGPHVAAEVLRRNEFKYIEFAAKPSQRWLQLVYTKFKNQTLKHVKTDKEFVEFYDQDMNKLVRSSNNYQKLFMQGRIYRDWTPRCVPRTELHIRTVTNVVLVILSIGLVIFIILSSLSRAQNSY